MHVLSCLEKIERNLLASNWSSVKHESNQIKKDGYEKIIVREAESSNCPCLNESKEPSEKVEIEIFFFFFFQFGSNVINILLLLKYMVLAALQ